MVRRCRRDPRFGRQADSLFPRRHRVHSECRDGAESADERNRVEAGRPGHLARERVPEQLYWPSLLTSQGVEFIEVPWSRFYSSLTRTRAWCCEHGELQHRLSSACRRIGPGAAGSRHSSITSTERRASALCSSMWSAVQPDMLAVHGYKWLLCPNGAGFMYVRPLTARTAQAQCSRVGAATRIGGASIAFTMARRSLSTRREIRRRHAELSEPLCHGRVARDDARAWSGSHRGSRAGSCRAVRSRAGARRRCRSSIADLRSSQRASRIVTLLSLPVP